MPFFTFKENPHPIAIVKGGEYNGNIVYLDKEKDGEEHLYRRKCCDDCSEKCFKKKCCKKCNYAIGGCRSKECDKENYLDEFDKIFAKEIKRIVNNRMENVNLKDGGKLIPIPRNERNQVEHLFITGPSGSGKSTFAAMYAKMFYKMFPKHNFYVVSDVKKDEVLDKLKPKPKRITIDEQMYEDPIDISDFKDSLVLFDDIEHIKDKKIQKATMELRDKLLGEGRHHNTRVMTISHNPTNNKETKASLLEARSIVMFPGGGDDYHLKNVLERYCSIDPKMIKEILKMDTRWIMVHKHFPKYVITENSCFIVK